MKCAAQGVQDLADLSLEQLGNVRVSTIAKRGESLAEAPASVYVITREDIRRSGINSLPELLRLAPNLQVARVNASRYAITARGHNSTTANKLLVQIDGRSVYTPLFSGVFWEVQDLMLEDIDRIEIISGPGATSWGSNAVNGVINVVTRRARLTKDGLAAVSVGDAASGAWARFGGSLGSDGAYRVYAKHATHQDTEYANGTSAKDAWRRSQAGFRADFGTDTRGMSLLGNAYAGSIEQVGLDSIHVSGGNLMFRWFEPTADGGRQRIQAIYDGTRRDQPGTYKERLEIVDLDALRSWNLAPDHVFTASAGYRFASDRIVNSAVLSFLPAERDLRWANIMVQDDRRLTPNWRLLLGLRAEYNAYTHWEALPSLRLSGKLGSGTLWGSLSRSVRAPSRVDRDFHVPGPPLTLAGGPAFGSEVSNTAEIGYRSQASPAFSYSLTTFYHRFKRLRGFSFQGSNLVIDNSVDGRAYGAEGWGSYRVSPRWRLEAGFMRMRQHFAAQAGGLTSSVGNDPKYQITARSTLAFGDGIDATLSVRHVAELPSPVVPAYTAVDLNIAYRPKPGVEMGCAFFNLADAAHREWGNTVTGSEIVRSVQLTVRLAF